MNLFVERRNRERLADLATDVAEVVVYMVEGRTIKHHAEDGFAELRGNLASGTQ